MIQFEACCADFTDTSYTNTLQDMIMILVIDLRSKLTLFIQFRVHAVKSMLFTITENQNIK